MFPSGFGNREVFGEASLSTRRLLLFWMMAGPEVGVSSAWCTGAVAMVILGAVLCSGSGWL
jgi:hypothetical protein